MATITAVAALDTLDEGRVKWNTSDTNLNNAIAATDALFATHVGTGTGSGHATYAAYEARIAALEGIIRKVGVIPFAGATGTGGRMVIGGYVPTSASDPIGLPMPYDGCIVAYTVTNSSGVTRKVTLAYNDAGTHFFNAGDMIMAIDIGTDTYPMINASGITALNIEGAGVVSIGDIVVEFAS